MAPGEPAIELVANFFVALAAVDSAAALSGAVVGSGGSSSSSVGPVSIGARSYSKALPVRRFIAARSSSLPSVAEAAAALAALPSVNSSPSPSSSASRSPSSSNAAALRRFRSLFQAEAIAAATASTATPPSTAVALVSPSATATTTTVTTLATTVPASPYLVLPSDLSAACLSAPPGSCGTGGLLSPQFAFSFDSQLVIVGNLPVTVGTEIRLDAEPLTGIFTFWLKDPDTGADFPSLPAGASPVRLALPYASDPSSLTQSDGLTQPITPPDPNLYARACLRLSGPSQWEVEAFDGEGDGFAFCLTRSTGQFVVVTYALADPSTPTPTPTATTTTTPTPTPTSTATPPPPSSSPWVPPSADGGFVVGSGTPPFSGGTTTPQIAFYVLFEGFPDFVAFENTNGRARFEEDLRAFFLSPLPWEPQHLLQRLFIFDVRTGASGSGALVGAAVEFLDGAQGAEAALLLQKTATLLTQPGLVFVSTAFYGEATALSAASYGGAVDPSLVPLTGGGDGSGGSGSGGSGDPTSTSTPTPTPTATTTTTPTPTPSSSSPWVPPPPSGGFVVGGGTPPFGAHTTTPQIAFYVLFEGFPDFVAFENTNGRARFEEDLRAFFLSPLPWEPSHLLQRLFIFDVRTGASGSGALVGAAVEFLGGAEGAEAALLLQKTATLLTQPGLVFGSSAFYGRATALSVAAYGGAVDPSEVPLTGSGDGEGSDGSGSGSGIKKKSNAGAIAGGVVGGLVALALLSYLARRFILKKRGNSPFSSASSPASTDSPQQFIANAAADPNRPQGTAVAAVAAPQPQPQPQPSQPPPPPAAGSASGGLETPLVS